MFSIGEFSQITGLTVKTLRFYHEEGLLIPRSVDQQSGYRYYDESQIEAARTIAHLRSLEFPLSDIKEILGNQGDDEEILHLIERQKAALKQKIERFSGAVRSLDKFISEERGAKAMAETVYQIEEKTQEPMLVAGIRMQGRYSECGQAFGKLGRSLGRHVAGRPFLLHYDSEYKEQDADYEACMPIRRHKTVDGVSVRELPRCRCVSLVHRGPYEQLGHSYAKILKYVKGKGYKIVMPTREIYLKEPGMLFKGNPKNYLTELQIPVDAEENET